MYKVLIVEDEDIVHRGLMFMMNWQQIDYVIAGETADDLEGLEKTRETEPDITIVNINMSVMDGLEMLEKSTREYRFDAIIISECSESEYARRTVTLGVTEYLLKPVNFNELYDALGKIIQKRMATVRLRGEMRQIDMEKKKLGILDSLSPEELVKGNPHVEFMMDCIREHYYSRVSLADVNEQCGMPCTYPDARFKSGTGYTFNDFLSRYRMQKAIEFLKENKYKVYEIVDLVGFSGYKYSIKVSKKYIGCSPIRFTKGGGNSPE